MADEAMTSERELNERNIEEFRRNGGKVGGPFESFPWQELADAIGKPALLAHSTPRQTPSR
jgi:hypothetical protein